MSSEWQTHTIGDFLTLEYGKPLDKKDRKVDGLYPAYGANGIKARSDKYLCESKAIIIGRKGSAGELTITEDRFWPLDVTYFVKFDAAKYDLTFVYYLLSLLSLPDLATGVKPGINRNRVYEIQVKTPSLFEQQRIVAILDQAFADIEKARANAEKNLKNARELFDSYAQNIFSQKKDGWLERSLGELGKVSMCKRILKKQTSASGEIPFYKIGTFGKTANAFIDSDLYEDYKTRFSFPKVGDILISASGTIGRCVVYDGQPAYFQDSNIVWIDNNERLVLNEYLLHFYKVCDWNPSKGATISRLYNDDLKKIKIAFPSKSEQLRVSKDISELNKKILSLQLIYEKKLASLAELKKSLLQKAFSGELTKTEGHAA